MTLNAPSGPILPRYRWPENIFDVRHPAAGRAGRVPTEAPSERYAGTEGRVTIALIDTPQPLFSPFHPMPRSPVTGCHH